MKWKCDDFEGRLAIWIAGELGGEETAAGRAHLRECKGCHELVELATLEVPVETPDDSLLHGILELTSGPTCTHVEPLLAAPAAETDVDRIAAHLEHCDACTRLRSALEGLDRDLPPLADLVPGGDFVQEVLAASLPLVVRWRRWRRTVWPQWIERPRFAFEAAYALTVLFLVFFQIAGAPLSATRTRAFVRNSPLEALEQPVRERLASWEMPESAGRLGRVAIDRAGKVGGVLQERTRTFRQGIASWWESADEGSASEAAKNTEEKP